MECFGIQFSPFLHLVAKPNNLYLQAKLLAPTKNLLVESEVIKKTATPDWSQYPPTIHNVKGRNLRAVDSLSPGCQD